MQAHARSSGSSCQAEGWCGCCPIWLAEHLPITVGKHPVHLLLSSLLDWTRVCNGLSSAGSDQQESWSLLGFHPPPFSKVTFFMLPACILPQCVSTHATNSLLFMVAVTPCQDGMVEIDETCWQFCSHCKSKIRENVINIHLFKSSNAKVLLHASSL